MRLYMIKKIFFLVLLISNFFYFANLRAQLTRANGTLVKMTGNLAVSGFTDNKTYEVYFHIPITSTDQAPILLEVNSPDLIDYRFIHINPTNVIIAAQMEYKADSTNLEWTAWVLVTEDRYPNFPSFVAIPNSSQLPDSVKKWLNPSDCVQSGESLVQKEAEMIRGSTTNLIKLADDICEFCYNIPWWTSWPPPHLPLSFDAIHALKWANSCTGHAHAGAALFRANGIPARVLLDIPLNFSNLSSDQHWIIEYFIPDYGWVKMETSTGENPFRLSNQIITFICNPEHEFPVFYPWGHEGLWHTSDPELILNWGRAHNGHVVNGITNSMDTVELASSLTNSVFHYYTSYWSIHLPSAQQTTFQNAFNYQKSALDNISNKDMNSYITNMRNALNAYKMIDIEPNTTIFFDDFENGSNGWIHGGNEDEWELGVPVFGLTQAYSGENCWGTDLDDNYENNAECWLKSPIIDLSSVNCAYLSFWIWNWVEDINYGPEGIFDRIWIDITQDGITFYPLCNQMGGVNDDPEIPDVGGWNNVILDLTKYAGHTVQIRFRFESDAEINEYGSFIDDVHVYGRYLKKLSVPDYDLPVSQTYTLFQNYPNPFNPQTQISFYLPIPGEVSIAIFNSLGQKVNTLFEGEKTAGLHSVSFNAEGLSSGVYFYRIDADKFTSTKKMLYVR